MRNCGKIRRSFAFPPEATFVIAFPCLAKSFDLMESSKALLLQPFIIAAPHTRIVSHDYPAFQEEDCYATKETLQAVLAKLVHWPLLDLVVLLLKTRTKNLYHSCCLL